MKNGGWSSSLADSHVTPPPITVVRRRGRGVDKGGTRKRGMVALFVSPVASKRQRQRTRLLQHFPFYMPSSWILVDGSIL